MAMMAGTKNARGSIPVRSLHGLGVLCALVAGMWLGAAEAPTKLVDSGTSPFTISLCMVMGVFTARWTFPTLLKGTSFVFADLAQKKHLVIWAVLAGSLWAVANTLTIFAIRDVGLSIAFPLWNTNALIGLLWARLLFGELKGARPATIAKVVAGAVCIVLAAILLGFSTLHGRSLDAHRIAEGIVSACGASLLWGTMYVPYRKAYLSGMNPLSFVTVFTVGELLTMVALACRFDGGLRGIFGSLSAGAPYLFWLFLGGFVWVVGDLFQQFAAKYLGIGRGIPLTSTNQLWGLAWGALVFGELAGANWKQGSLVAGGSLLMIAGALLIGTAKSSGREDSSRNEALERECVRYGLDYRIVLAADVGEHFDATSVLRRWWDVVIVMAAVGIFVYLGSLAAVPRLAMNLRWAGALGVVPLFSLFLCGYFLYRETRFT
jgi:glucose uptake protein GlcU